MIMSISVLIELMLFVNYFIFYCLKNEEEDLKISCEINVILGQPRCDKIDINKR